MTGLPRIVGELSYREQPGRWRFVLNKPLRIRFPLDYWGEHNLADAKGKVWVRTTCQDWIIEPEYAWNGASFAINFASTIAASAWHDSAGQFRHVPCIKEQLSWWRWNKRFAEIIRGQGDAVVAAVYHLGLTIGNPFYQLVGKLVGNKPEGTCLKL